MQTFQVSYVVQSDRVQKGAGLSVQVVPVHRMAITSFRVLERLCGCKSTTRGAVCVHRLVPPWAAGVVHDLSLNNPLPLIVPPRTVAVMTAISLPIIADVAFVLYLSNAVLSSCSDAVRYLDQFKDVLLEEHSRSAVCRDSGWKARGIDLHISNIASRRRTARSPHSHNRAHRWLL